MAHLTPSFPCICPLTGFNFSVYLFFFCLPFPFHFMFILSWSLAWLPSPSPDPPAGPVCLRSFLRCCWQSFSSGDYNHGLYLLPPAPKVDCIWLPSLCYFHLKVPCCCHVSAFLLDHDFLMPWAEMAPHQWVYSYLTMLDLTQSAFQILGISWVWKCR